MSTLVRGRFLKLVTLVFIKIRKEYNMDTIIVNKIITPESCKTNLKTKEIIVNLRHFVALEKSSKGFSSIILSTGESWDISNEYACLREQIAKQRCIRTIEVNKIVTTSDKKNNLKTEKMTINLEAIVSFERTSLNPSPVKNNSQQQESIISLSTGSNIKVNDSCESVMSYIQTSKNNKF